MSPGATFSGLVQAFFTDRLLRQRGSSGQVTVNPIRTGVIGGQKTRRAKPIIHFTNVGRTCQNIVVRVVGVVAELVSPP